ncbi:MAG: methyltransferase domain-containing protein [Pseudomonadota bacterium]
MTKELEFTGERFTPECVREIWYEHVHRYAFAAPLVAGKRVLDAACGEGYGSALLATTAASVDGVDVAAEAVDHARARYAGVQNLEFHRSDVTGLPFPDDHFEAIVSFETLEHLEAQDAMLSEFRRVLRDDGVLLISSPDRAVYSDQYGNDNEFHVRELYREELEALLARHFPAVRLLGQKLLFHSAIWQLDRVRSVSLQQGDSGRVGQVATPSQAAMYFLAFCASRAEVLPELDADLQLFDDADESVYAHYHGEIRRNMAAGGIIAERDAEIARLKTELERALSPRSMTVEQEKRLATAERPGWWRRLFHRGGA